MSVESSIHVKFANLPQSYKRTDLIKILLKNGWTLNDTGGISYLPLGDDGDFDWILSSKISQDELMLILEEKEKKKELIGIVLTWQNTNVGGTVLFYSNNTIMFVFNVNRKVLYGLNDFKMTDLNWYSSRLIPIFYENNMLIKSFTFDEAR